MSAQHQNPFGNQAQAAAAHQSLIELNRGGYLYERFDMKLEKLLSCSNGDSIYNNLMWNEEQRYIAYSAANIVVIESLN